MQLALSFAGLAGREAVGLQACGLSFPGTFPGHEAFASDIALLVLT